MIGEIDGGFSWEGKNKVVNLFLHPVFGQGWQAHRKLEMVFQDGISVSEYISKYTFLSIFGFCIQNLRKF